MIEENIAFIANYFWKESIDNINSTLSDTQMSNFNVNDYYYLTSIYQMGFPKLGELAAKLNLTKPAISALVRRLEKSELIIKTQSEADKRIYHLSLTEKGKKIIQMDFGLYSKLSDILSDLLTGEEIDMVDNILKKVVSRLSEE